MLIARIAVGMCSVGLIVLGTSAVSGQSYPNKPIRIVTGGIGSAVDLPSRLVAQGLIATWGQPVIVDNRGSGMIPGEIVSKAPPDGYTLLYAGGSHAIGPLLQKAPYDPVKDFAAITWATKQPNILVVHPSVPVKSVKELIALAKAKPGELNYSSGGTGSTNHLSAELFKSMAGVNFVRIPYKSGSLQMADLLGGQVQLTFGSVGSVAPHIKSGKLRGLAVTDAQPSALFPELPTIAASGLPGYESTSMSGVFAPARTPAMLIDKLNQQIVRLLNTPDVKQKLFDSGVETVGSSPQEYAAKTKAEIARLGKLIRDAGIKAD